MSARRGVVIRSVFEWHPRSAERARVIGLRPDDPVLPLLFESMGNPSTHATDREGGCEEPRIEPEPMQQQGGVELDIRLKPASRFVLLEQTNRGRFDRSG